MENYRILRPAEVAEKLGICTVTLWRYSKDPNFPQKIKIGERAVGYRSDQLAEWIDKRQAEAVK